MPEITSPTIPKDTFSTRLADKITTFVGSMRFVYIHAVIFALWTGTGLFGIDEYPFNFLTMIVSLEAIFLSTFVMIAQNRQDAFAQAKADREYQTDHIELLGNTSLNREILAMTKKIHDISVLIHDVQKELRDHIKNTM
jgi:uncharacterized membrane protein